MLVLANFVLVFPEGCALVQKHVGIFFMFRVISGRFMCICWLL